MNILCFGDSNTHGYNPKNSMRYERDIRWTGILQKELGENYYVIEEGLNSRTIAMDDPVANGKSSLSYIEPCLYSHKPIDLIIVMLGTNDTKERFSLNSDVITLCMRRLIITIQNLSFSFNNGKANILLVAPLPLKDELEKNNGTMGIGAVQKSKEIVGKYESLSKELGCYFFNPSLYTEVSDIDFMHYSEEAHKIFATKIKEKILEIEKNI